MEKQNHNTTIQKRRPIYSHQSQTNCLANTIYKLYTSTFTSILSSYGETHHILHERQEGFRAEWNTARQIQTIIAALEDAKFTNQDICIMYIDFKNAFGSIDHARLLAIMTDLGFPDDAVTLVGNIYSQSTTTYTGEHFGKTHPIPIQRAPSKGIHSAPTYS